MSSLVGIDGCRAGWVVATADDSLESFGLRVAPTLNAVLDQVDRLDGLVAIDVPIGLSDDGSRQCDLAARAFLKGHRKSSVFPAPCRVTLAACSYEDACQLNARACGKKVTRELFNILPKIRDVDLLVNPARQARVRESHPEVIFATLAGSDVPALPPKRQSDGQERRVEILRRFLPGVSLDLLRRERSRLVRDVPEDAARDITQEREDDALASKPGAETLALKGPGLQPLVPAPGFQARACRPEAIGRTGPTWRPRSSSDLALDDLIDALACLVTAYRLRTGAARVFPDGPARWDSRGLRMEIVA